MGSVHKYPPLQILYIVGIIFPVLQGVSYALFSFQDSAAIYLVVFRLIVFISGLIGMILYIVLILHPNTTKPMKIVLFIILISSFVGRVATSIYQWGINFGFVTDHLNAARFMGFFQNGLMVLSTLLTALWFYLILKEEEMSDYLETTQELV